MSEKYILDPAELDGRFMTQSEDGSMIFHMDFEKRIHETIIKLDFYTKI